jgi:quercetin dioxygenase-like cupin family protein
MPIPPDAYRIAGKEPILATAEARVTLMTLDPGQAIAPHAHSQVTDTTFCLAGLAVITLQNPSERLRLTPGDRAVIAPGRVHAVANAGTIPCRLLLVQGPGSYDFNPA